MDSTEVAVLYVDADPAACDLTVDFLHQGDYAFDVTTVTGVSEGLAHVNDPEVRVDCVVSDFEIRDRTGLDFLTAIRRDDGSLPFILFTELGGESFVTDALRTGVTDYVRKAGPETYSTLAHRIEIAVCEPRDTDRWARNRYRFDQLVDHLNEVIWIFGPEFEEVMYVSGAFEEIWGHRPHELANDRSIHLERLHPDDRERVQAQMRSQMADIGEGNGSETLYEFRIVRSNGEVRWVESVSFPLFDADGALDSFAGIARDVTERIERERRYERQIEQLDQTASFISHDLRNPINVAQGNLDLYRETNDPERLATAREALDRIEAISTDMLELVRLDSTSPESTKQPLGDLIDAAWAAVETRNADLVIVEECEIEASESHIRSLFENLIRNAVGHGGNDVTVRVGPLPDGFYFEDTGIGIDSEERVDVLTHGYSTGYEGTGTGLTIVKRVAQAHDLDVEISESAEGGARFEFRDARPPRLPPGTEGGATPR